MYTFFFAERVKKIDPKLAANVFAVSETFCPGDRRKYRDQCIFWSFQKLIKLSGDGALQNQLTSLFYGRTGV
jgi:hypothetical protein